jgi:hypothetical protein
MNRPLTTLGFAIFFPAFAAAQTAPYPRSPAISGVSFNDGSTRTLAPGSDNWPMTWASNGHQYTTWGDGGGFGGTDSAGRVSIGIARVEGGRSGYVGVNIAGGVNSSCPSPFSGKSEGILAIGNTLYLWRNGDGSGTAAFKFSRLYRSDDLGCTWSATGVEFSKSGGDFTGADEGFFAPVFLQFGQGYAGARDSTVYLYAPEIIDRTHWNLQKPGRISLLRVDKSQIGQKSAYRYFAGLSGGAPTWTSTIANRKPVWQDATNGTHRIAASYNPALRRYLLTSMWGDRVGRMGIYDAPEPWGPWTTVLMEQDTSRWGSKCIIFTFANKWLSADGKSFVIVHTKDDRWATIEGAFTLASSSLPVVTVTAADAGASEPGTDTGRFTISRTGATTSSLAVNYTLGGSAANGSDYDSLATSVTIPAGSGSASVTVTPRDDATVESAESVVLTLSASSSYTVGSPNTATVTIADNDSTNRPPAVSITSPANNATFAAGANIAIQATASDADGSVARVEFFASGVLLGTDTTSPYSYAWNNVPAGDYALTARATDNAGATATSARVDIMVTGGGTPLSVTIDFVSTGKAYSTATARAGALYYIDRSYTIASLGAALAGGVLIRTANDDKYVTASAHLQFSVSADATLYACTDRRATTLPVWLRSGWTALSETFSVSDAGASPMRVFRRSVPAGQVTLGGNHHGGDTGARSNYVVVVQPAASLSVSHAAALPETVWEHPGDSDGDGLADSFEATVFTDPQDPDTDGDGEPDETELDATGRTLFDVQAAGVGPPAPPAGGDGGGCGATGLEALVALSLLRNQRRRRMLRSR